ncbi:DUF2254 domain-containing protein [Legionella septentrionalis]|uniref:DUF2254 domain-containing protein n=1 Tax=Legionella septentrionalis TaxID=2498109 RepID=A0A433JHM3_9GAMM|nr:DUF2254 domain-containing protein [Legionella septentrionalis]RUQ82078.1 DUF2254 domain-containing protein [Legionella septentrionalis]RUR08942.1 DUF2254 domain-containing protein [Legionella septentrionalis]RUR14727.1 DUF2254 domain-containing protein [Legionella septentrionalis]
MHSKLLNFFSELRTSYWYIPLLLSIFSLLLSMLTLRLDRLFVWHWLEYMGWFHASNPEGARAILSTIANSMISVAGVSFSMTIVAVAFAGSQVGPRLTTNFMRDRINQITLGIFIATFLYCLFILLALFNANKNGIIELNGIFIPQISLLVAILLSISSIIVLIYFFHHIPESINMSNVIARVGGELNEQLECIFPGNLGIECSNKQCSFNHLYPKITPILATQQGYIRIIDGKSLLNIAKKEGLIIQLEVRCGDFITNNTHLLTIYSKELINDAMHKQCLDVFALGTKRNPEQDPLFLVDELVEIIARALSPGINDPFTAITCMDWLQSSIQKLSDINLPSAYRYDTENQLRVIAQPIAFSEFCELIFSRIQPYVCKDRNASIHMMNMLGVLHGISKNQEHKNRIASHANSLKNAARECLLKDDAEKVMKNYEKHFQPK